MRPRKGTVRQRLRTAAVAPSHPTQAGRIVTTLPIGIQTRSLRLPLRRALAVAAELGAEGVEIDLRNELRIADFSQTALREFRRLLEEQQLRVLAVSFPTRGGMDDADGLERRLLATREAMTFGYKIGAGVLIGRVGEVPDSEDLADATTLIDSLRLLGAHGEHVGTRFAFASGADAASQRSLIETVGEGTVGVSLHPPLLLGGGIEPADAAAELGTHVLHAHAVDAVRETSASQGGVTEVPLGRGEADLPAILAALEERGYRGPVTIERGGSDPLEDIRNAVAYLRQIGG